MKINKIVSNSEIASVSSPFFTCCAVLFLAISCSAQAASTLEKAAQSGVLTLGYQDAPPFSLLDESKRPIGYSIDICMKVFDAVKRELKRPDLAVKFVQVAPVTSFTALTGGEIDLECSNTANTRDRRNKVAFTVPTFIASTRLMVRKGSGINSVADLSKSGLTIVTIWGSRGEKIFDDMKLNRTLRGNNLIVNDFEGAYSVLEKDKADAFNTDKADAFIMDEVLLSSLRAASKSPENLLITRDALTIESLSLMLRKDDPAFKKLVDTEVARVITQGEINPIYRKWFESPIPPKQLNLNLPMPYVMRDSFRTPTDWVPN